MKNTRYLLYHSGVLINILRSDYTSYMKNSKNALSSTIKHFLLVSKLIALARVFYLHFVNKKRWKIHQKLYGRLK